MTKIKNYELDSTINDDDKVIGTDGLPGPNFGRTKNYSIGSLVTYIENQLDPVDGSGTLNTIPIWTPDGDTLGDSIMTYDTGTITVAGGLGITGALLDGASASGTANQLLTSTGTQTSWQDFSTLVPNNITGSGTLNTIAMFTPDGTAVGNSNITQDVSGNVTIGNNLTVNGSVTLGDSSADITTINSTLVINNIVQDSNQTLGTNGQLLVSNAASELIWQDFATLVPNNITGSGTLNTIPMFKPDGQKIGNSIITQNALGTAIAVNGIFTVDNALTVTNGGDTNVVGDLEVNSSLTVDESTTLNGEVIVQGALIANDPVTMNSTLTVGNVLAGEGGEVTFSGNVVIGDGLGLPDYLTISSSVQDANATIGTEGQILVANSSSRLIWQDQAGDTTYSVSSQQAASDVEIVLTGSDVTESEVTLVAGNSITLTDDGSNNITIAATGGAANTTYSLNNVQGATTTDLQLVGSDATADSYRFSAGTGVSFDQTVVGVTTIDFDISTSGAVSGSGDLNHFAIWSPDGQTLDSSPFFIETFSPLKAVIRGNDANLAINALAYGNATLTFEPNISGNNLGVFNITDPVPAIPSTKFAWKKGGSEYMRLDTVTGNLGVGTTDPSHKVTVEGQAGFKATDGGIIYFNVNKDNFSGVTFIGTGVNGASLYIGAPVANYSQQLQVLGTGKFRDGIKDISDSVGTSGQILTSTGSQVQWVDLSGLIPNNVSGTGTENFGALWGAGGTVLTNSLLKHGTGVDSIGIGLNNDTQGLESIAFTRSTSISNYSFALGYESITDGEFSVTLGKGTYTAGRHAMATNYKSLALGQSSFAGGHTSATGGDGAVALGHNASAGNFGAAKLVATFPNDQTTFDIEGIVGTVEAGLFMRYGENLDVPDPRIEILTFTDNGNNSATLTVAAPGIRPIQGELVVFEEATPFRGDHQGGVALGNDAYSLGEGTVSIGHTSVAEADKAVALGDAAKSSGASSVAIGKNATVTSADTIALGGDSTKILMNALAASSSYADDVAAAAGGVAVGELYRNGNIVQIRLT